jgi:hypothetical protein
VQKAYLLASPERTLDNVQSRDDNAGHDVLSLTLPGTPPDEDVSVVVLELDAEPAVDPLPLQQPDGAVNLIPSMADLHGPAEDGLEIAMNGMTQNWYEADRSVSWTFKVSDPGRFELKIVTGTLRGLDGWVGGHRVSLSVGGAFLTADITPDEPIDTPHAQYFPECATRLGSIEIDSPGIHELTLEALTINPNAPAGLTVANVTLTRVS